MMITVRDEKPEDVAAVREINELAFKKPVEANIVERLRAACKRYVSLVAVIDEKVAGHILFTPVSIDGFAISGGVGLAPMAVHPERQNRGVGKELVRAGIARLESESCPFIIVLGHPAYYPRFGFERASGRGLSCQWEGIPDEGFMMIILDNQVMDGVTGVVRYRDEFDTAV